MRALLHKKRRFTSILLLVCFAVLLGFQVAEATHMHVDAIDYPDCVQCQVDGSAALAEPSHAQALQTYAANVATSYQSLALIAPFSLSSPRGPPALPC